MLAQHDRISVPTQRVRTIFVVVLVSAIAAAPGASASVRRAPKAHAANAIVGAIGEAVAKSGVAFITRELKKANTGDPKADAAIGFVVKLLEDPVLSQLEAVTAELQSVRSELKIVNEKLDEVRAAVLQGTYNTLVGQTSDVIGQIKYAENLLLEIAKSRDPAQRKELGRTLDNYIGDKLMDKQASLALRMTPEAPGGEGLIVTSSKAAAAAQRFLTPRLSRIPYEVYKYFSLYEGLLLQLRVEHMHAHPNIYSKEQIGREIDDWTIEFGRQSVLRPIPVQNYTFLDTQTGLLWGWAAKDRVFDSKLNDDVTPGTPFKMTWKLALADDQRFPPGRARYMAGFSWGERWVIPTMAQVQSLFNGRTGSPVSWLNERTGGVFPATWSPGGTSLIWTYTPASGTHQQGYDLANGNTANLYHLHEFGLLETMPRPNYDGTPYPTEGFATHWWYW
jgi:hypothetical protein